MTTLRADISSHTSVLPVDAPMSNPSYPFFRDIDVETVKVIDGADTTEWQVERGVASTQAARHGKGVNLVVNASPYASGGGGVTMTGSQGGSVTGATELRVAGTVSDLGSGVAGQGLVFSFQKATVHYDTPLLNNPTNFGADVMTVPAGSLFQCFAIITHNWNEAGQLAIAASVDGVAGANIDVGYYVAIAARQTGEDGDGISGENNRDAGHTPTWQYAAVDAHIVVGFYPDGVDPTTGTADIYAIIATPAS